MSSAMNFIKCDKHFANRLLIGFRYGYKLMVYSNCRQLSQINTHLNQNHLWFWSQKHSFPNECNYLNHFYNNNTLLDNKYNLSHNSMSIRCLSKGTGRDKLKDKRKGAKPKVVLNDSDMNELIPINELKIELNNVIERFKTDLISNVNIRTNPQSIEHLTVELADGRKHSLNEITNITRKSPQLVVLNLSSMPDAIKPVLTAIQDSGMNINPQIEGNIIYLPIPKVTREHREGLATNAKTLCQRAKDEVKDIQSSFTSYVRKQKKANVSEELIFNVNENLKYLIDIKVHELDAILEQKLKELLK